MERRNWTREETILAFDLYCRTPYGRIHANNPDIVGLAKIIDRSPAAVVRKMGNLAHFDPVHQARDVKGLSHASKLDPIIFYEFYQNIEELSFQAQNIIAQKKGIHIEQLLDEEDSSYVYNIPEGTYRKSVVKQRIGQSSFRHAVLNAYNNRCCITGLSIPELLIASHIKPWADCNEKNERTNPCNGLCLNAFHDKAFDKGLITVTPNDYRIIISQKLKYAEMDEDIKAWILKYENEKISMPSRFYPQSEYLEYHNDVVFKKK